MLQLVRILWLLFSPSSESMSSRQNVGSRRLKISRWQVARDPRKIRPCRSVGFVKLPRVPLLACHYSKCYGKGQSEKSSCSQSPQAAGEWPKIQEWVQYTIVH